MSGEGGGGNRLAGEESPYLRLHAHNPVDWYPWGEEALERARGEDKPIFLSVGYSTCYWCHVMERESFSDPRIAELMNESFVNVKLDREERPDLDEIYMTATQILTQQGGWPNSVFLTPELKPFFAGTYFPPDDRHGRPGFDTVLRSLAEAWKGRRRDVQEQAENVAEALRRFLEERAEPAAEVPPESLAGRAADDLARRYDARWGGFGGAPKFPTPSNLFLLLELADERPAAGEMLASTLRQMAAGGIYDQLAGGFHRYATDREWRVPHFEKMLYDNGLLLELYAREWRRTGDPEMRRIARETAAFIGREMTGTDGAFWSAIDAETQGHEGAYYVWSREQLLEVLGPEDFGFLAPLLGFDGAPFFEGGSYVLHLPLALEAQAERRRTTLPELLAEIEPLRARLLDARGQRERPLTDDKVLADWNGMAVTGLAVAGDLLGDPEMVRRAAAAAELILDRLRPDGGPLRHAWRRRPGRAPAFLGDYVYFVRGLLALHRATGEGGWLAAAVRLSEEQEERLGDPEGGYFVAAESPDVLFRSKEVFDGAVPAANAVAALNQLELAAATGERAWAAAAERTLRAFTSLAAAQPGAVKMLAVAAHRLHRAAAAGTAAGAGGRGAGSLDAEAQSRVSAELEVEKPAADGWQGFRLALEIAEGWHVYAPDAPAATTLPTRLAGEGVELRSLVWPAAEPTGEESVPVYRGAVEIRGELRAAAAGSLALAFQPCDDTRCLPPATLRLAVPGPAS